LSTIVGVIQCTSSSRIIRESNFSRTDSLAVSDDNRIWVNDPCRNPIWTPVPTARALNRLYRVAVHSSAFLELTVEMNRGLDHEMVLKDDP